MWSKPVSCCAISKGVICGMSMTLDRWIRSQVPRLTDTEFGRQIGVTQQIVGMWRRGERVPGSDNLRRIEQVTGGLVCVQDFKANGKGCNHAAG